MVTALLASGDPRAAQLLNWMTGSTYAVDTVGRDACTAGCAMVALAGLPLLARWLDIVPLGTEVPSALGLPRRSRAVLLAVTAALTAVSTLIIGPLTFVGLMAPHLARHLGLRRALPELAGAALVGGILMVVADWLGRTMAFPWQIPAGLAATFIGCPALMWLLARRSSR